jgi:hypothetical protein
MAPRRSSRATTARATRSSSNAALETPAEVVPSGSGLQATAPLIETQTQQQTLAQDRQLSRSPSDRSDAAELLQQLNREREELRIQTQIQEARKEIAEMRARLRPNDAITPQRATSAIPVAVVPVAVSDPVILPTLPATVAPAVPSIAAIPQEHRDYAAVTPPYTSTSNPPTFLQRAIPAPKLRAHKSDLTHSDARRYIDSLENYFDTNDLPPQDHRKRIAIAQSGLDDLRADKWSQRVASHYGDDRSRITWPEFKDWLKEVIPPLGNTNLRRQLREYRQKSGQTLTSYLAEIERIELQLEQPLPEGERKDDFMRGLLPYIAAKADTAQHLLPTRDALFRFCQNVEYEEGALSSSDRSVDSQTPQTTPSTPATPVAASPPQPPYVLAPQYSPIPYTAPFGNTPQPYRYDFRRQPQRAPYYPAASPRPTPTPDSGAEPAPKRRRLDIVCFGCGKTGHFKKDCRQGLWCTYCNRSGHTADECRIKREHSSAAPAATPATQANVTPIRDSRNRTA